MQEQKEEKKFWNKVAHSVNYTHSNKDNHSTEDTHSNEDILSLTKFSYSQKSKGNDKKVKEDQICKYNHETCSSNNICYLG